MARVSPLPPTKDLRVNLFFRLLWLSVRSRFGPRLSLWATARTRFRVVPTDLDVLRHMNNGVYLSILDLGRTDLMIRSGFAKKISAAGWYPVVAGQTISYKRSLKLWQPFEVQTRMLGIDERAFFLEQTFVSRGEICARAVIQGRFLRRTGGSVTIAELDDLVGGIPPELQLPDWVGDWSVANRIRTS